MVDVFPLEHMGAFKIPPTKSIQLPVVSVVLETRPEMMDRIRAITEWHRKWFWFAREVVVSIRDPHIPGTSFIPCVAPPQGGLASLWYSDYCIRWMDRVCDSSFVLIWQWDGFIVNPEMWTNDFMNYDYVGAPIFSDYWHATVKWLEKNKPGWRTPPNLEIPIVGNGGFSLRSKRFLSTTAAMPVNMDSFLIRNEDQYLCIEKREELEGKGLKFCPSSLAKRFSKDECDRRPIGECFGFHDVTNLQEAKTALESRYMNRGM
jgi:hypothetical protein